MEPPSSTTLSLLKTGRISWALATLAMRLPIFSSFFQLGYFAHALKRHLIAASEPPVPLRVAPATLLPAGERRLPESLTDTTNVHPESRVQTRSVGQQRNVILSERALARRSTFLARFSDSASFTISSTRSCRTKLRMISAYTHGIGSNLPGQSPRK